MSRKNSWKKRGNNHANANSNTQVIEERETYQGAMQQAQVQDLPEAKAETVKGDEERHVKQVLDRVHQQLPSGSGAVYEQDNEGIRVSTVATTSGDGTLSTTVMKFGFSPSRYENKPTNIPMPMISADEVANDAGKLLSYHRMRLGYTQQEIADHIQARVATICDIESGQLLQQVESDNFALSVIRRYAQSLHLDPDKVEELYRKNCREYLLISTVKAKHAKRDPRMNQVFLILVLIILVATAGYFVFGGQNSKSNGEIESGAIPSSEQEQATPAVTVEPSATESGSLSLNGTEVTEQKEVKPEVVIEAPENKDAPPVLIVDKNTAKAAAQAYDLEMDAAKKANLANQNQTDTPSQLELPPDSALAQQVKEQAKAQEQALAQAQAQALSQAKMQKPEPSNASKEQQLGAVVEIAPPVESEIAPNEQTAKPAQEIVPVAPALEPVKPAVQELDSLAQDAAKAGIQEQQSVSAGTDEEPKQDVKQDVKSEAEAPKIVQTEEPKPTEEAPKLSAKLKDISNQAKIVDRNKNELASYNGGTFKALAPVYVRIVDGSNNVRIDGFYDKGKGDDFKGVPPFTVSVTDSAAVEISYAAGRISVPKAKQVKFKLPM